MRLYRVGIRELKSLPDHAIDNAILSFDPSDMPHEPVHIHVAVASVIISDPDHIQEEGMEILHRGPFGIPASVQQQLLRVDTVLSLLIREGDGQWNLQTNALSPELDYVQRLCLIQSTPLMQSDGKALPELRAISVPGLRCTL